MSSTPNRRRASSSGRKLGREGEGAREIDSVSASALGSRPATLSVRAIGARLGLSKSTVAAALRGESRHAAATIARVRAMAEALDYRPNPLVTANMMLARQARSGRPRGTTLGYLSDVPRPALLKADCPGHEGYVGARERARELGFGLDLIEYARAGMPPARLRNVIRNRGIRGFVIAPHTLPQIELDLGWEEFATVCIGFSVASPRFDRVGYDHHEAIVEVCRRMWHHGRRRMGLVMSDDFDARVLHLTRAGFLRWQSDHGGEAPPILILAGSDPAPLTVWFRRHSPDCIIAPGVDVVPALSALGRRVPQDVVVTTTMRMPGRPELGGFDISLRTLARSAVDLLAAKLFRNEQGIPLIRQTVLVLGPYHEPAAAAAPATGPAVAADGVRVQK
jgi:DNA-binding LacI/PurR family transcriptional regulator